MLNGSAEPNVIGKNAQIDASATVSDSVIWDNVSIDKNAKIYRSIIGDGVVIKESETHQNVAIVKAEMVRKYKELPEKALKGKFVGDNYVVLLDQ